MSSDPAHWGWQGAGLLEHWKYVAGRRWVIFTHSYAVSSGPVLLLLRWSSEWAIQTARGPQGSSQGPVSDQPTTSCRSMIGAVFPLCWVTMSRCRGYFFFPLCLSIFWRRWLVYSLRFGSLFLLWALIWCLILFFFCVDLSDCERMDVDWRLIRSINLLWCIYFKVMFYLLKDCFIHFSSLGCVHTLRYYHAFCCSFPPPPQKKSYV